MLDRRACERRVYRLAALLTGDSNSAKGVLAAVLGAQPNLHRLDSAHLGRLVILRSREVPPRAITHPLVTGPLADGLAALPAQQREAWVLTHVYRVPRRELSRAMDCSYTATKRHLQLADHAMTAATSGNQAAAADALLAYSNTLDVPDSLRAMLRRRILRRRAVRVMAVAALVAAVVAAILWWAASIA